MHVMLTGSVTGAQRSVAAGALLACAPLLAQAQSSPFMTGATALQTNILAWLTPIAVILVMVLGAMAMANRLVENCGNTLILRCSGSEHGGTSQFASRLIGEREVMRVTTSRSRRATEMLPAITHSQHLSIESAVMGSEIEQLPDLAGYLKLASNPAWVRVGLRPVAAARDTAAPATARGAGRILTFPDMRSPGAAASSDRESEHARDGFEPG